MQEPSGRVSSKTPENLLCSVDTGTVLLSQLSDIVIVRWICAAVNKIFKKCLF
jgi:hypothetical protein